MITLSQRQIERDLTIHCAPAEVSTDPDMTLCLTQTSHLTGGYLDLHVINWCPKLVHSEGFGIMNPVLQDSYYITHCINTSVFIQISPVNMINICIFLSLCYLNTIVSLMGFNKASFILLLRESKCFLFLGWGHGCIETCLLSTTVL